MIEDVLQQYNLSYSSIVIVNSNVLLHKHKSKVNVIYDNAMEMNSFNRGISTYGSEFGIKEKDFDEKFTIDNYLENIKHNKKRLLRLGSKHLPHQLRDKNITIYYIYKLGLQDKSVVDKRYFEAENVYDDSGFFKEEAYICLNSDFKELINLFKQ